MTNWVKQSYNTGTKFPYDIIEVDVNKHAIVSDTHISMTLTKQQELNDNFIIRLFTTGEIWIRYGNERSLNYAFNALNEQKESLYCGVLEGGPDFEIRGIIEGFYGTPWPHEDRLDVIDFIAEYRMNSYFYAPKDDLYHRQLWREQYPQQALETFIQLVNRAKEKHVDFYFCISPGNDFIYTDEHEFEVLFRKIDHLIEAGVGHFSLLLDDIDYVLKNESLERFQRPGVAHAYISNRLNRYLSTKLNTYKFVMCPTEYWQNWDTEYRRDLKEGLDENIIVFWTGYNTVAEYIPNEDGVNAQKYFGHPLLLWDNYPVNDMAYDHLFMGPIRNRGRKLYQTHIGMLSNPMVSWHLSKIPVITMADYMWNSADYNPEDSYHQAINSLTCGKIEFEKAFTIFCNEHKNSLIHYDKKIDIDHMIETLDLKGLNRYFNQMHSAIKYLMNQTLYPNLTRDAQPWFTRFMRDYKNFKKVKNGTIKPSDVSYIEDETHTMGYQVLAKLVKKMGIYEGKIYKKERANFWDNAKVIKP